MEPQVPGAARSWNESRTKCESLHVVLVTMWRQLYLIFLQVFLTFYIKTFSSPLRLHDMSTSLSLNLCLECIRLCVFFIMPFYNSMIFWRKFYSPYLRHCHTKICSTSRYIHIPFWASIFAVSVKYSIHASSSKIFLTPILCYVVRVRDFCVSI